jgi:hypothetical protein
MTAAGLDWISNRDAYQAMVHEAGRSNLLQSWAWGEAKHDAEGWRPRRAVLSVGGLAVACVQVLEKRLGPARVARINRGPLFFTDEPEHRRAVLARLRATWRWWRGSGLLIAPELPDAALPLALGLRPRAAPIWCSAWVDLMRPEDELRKALNGKWRNMLVGGEKSGLEVRVEPGEAGVARLLPLYQAMMAEKGFTGVPPAMLAALARHADADDMLTLFAEAGGEPASSVLVARHGHAATYLVGWNGEAGRKLKGNHLLLWRAMLECKARGVRWFDLGGIDAVLTPGVASFKRGLNGEEYTLAGEFLSF